MVAFFNNCGLMVGMSESEDDSIILLSEYDEGAGGVWRGVWYR